MLLVYDLEGVLGFGVGFFWVVESFSKSKCSHLMPL